MHNFSQRNTYLLFLSLNSSCIALGYTRLAPPLSGSYDLQNQPKLNRFDCATMQSRTPQRKKTTTKKTTIIFALCMVKLQKEQEWVYAAGGWRLVLLHTVEAEQKPVPADLFCLKLQLHWNAGISYLFYMPTGTLELLLVVKTVCLCGVWMFSPILLQSNSSCNILYALVCECTVWVWRKSQNIKLTSKFK